MLMWAYGVRDIQACRGVDEAGRALEQEETTNRV
jgi:hypothetical protein